VEKIAVCGGCMVSIHAPEKDAWIDFANSQLESVCFVDKFVDIL
jgi:hypothetical protein